MLQLSKSSILTLNLSFLAGEKVHQCFYQIYVSFFNYTTLVLESVGIMNLSIITCEIGSKHSVPANFHTILSVVVVVVVYHLFAYVSTKTAHIMIQFTYTIPDNHKKICLTQVLQRILFF